MKKNKSIDQPKKYENKISEIDPKAGDMQEANEALHKNVMPSLGNMSEMVIPANKVPNLKFTKSNKKSFDGKRMNGYVADEIGQFPAFDQKKIEKQLERLKVLETIENFCNEHGCVPLDLIENYKLVKGIGKLKSGFKSPKNAKIEGVPEKG